MCSNTRNTSLLLLWQLCVHFLHTNFQHLYILREHFIDTIVSVLTHEFKLALIIESKIKSSLHNSYDNTVAQLKYDSVL